MLTELDLARLFKTVHRPASPGLRRLAPKVAAATVARI
jgi:hypothetical protein